MNRLLSTAIILLMATAVLRAQDHQPTLEDCKLMFQDYYYLKDWEKAKKNLEFIIDNSEAPEEKYFIKGVKVYENLIKSTEDKDVKVGYQNKAIGLYKQRIAQFGDNDQVQKPVS